MLYLNKKASKKVKHVLSPNYYFSVVIECYSCNSKIMHTNFMGKCMLEKYKKYCIKTDFNI